MERVKCIDPDYRRDPKTKRFCIRCQRDIYDGAKYMLVYIRASGHEAVHPRFAKLLADSKELGWQPIGMDCARIIGLDWCKEP